MVSLFRNRNLSGALAGSNDKTHKQITSEHNQVVRKHLTETR